MFRPLTAASFAITLLPSATAADAQLAQNGTSTGAVTFSNAALTATLAHTTPNFANRWMFVGVHLNIGGSSGATVASVTYGGVSATLVQAINDAGAPNTRTELWSLIAPPTGANNTVVTLRGQVVIITGTNLTGATSVTFGGSAAVITANTSTSITVITPAHTIGRVDVIVTTPAGITTLPAAYLYVAEIPTLSAWLLIALAAALMTIGALKLRL